MQHGRLVVERRLPERIAAEREARVVVEDVDPAELGDGAADERGGALLVGHVERERDVGLDPLDAARAADDRTPASRSFRTVAAPMPLEAPVTIAVFPARSTGGA